ncbi:hypothetical protein SAMN05192583_0071 [Sphingomonas gellani]|uniref:Uncharacterized protein n=2 Tax=Sphingomonas gellani TaxID=1166340 RepID=A0A1H7Y3R9_9SPHN|nr:hypothetical protein SAMN05192583_0071 [Sphingomonas gellani]
MASEDYDTYVWQTEKLFVVFKSQIGGRKWNLTYRLPTTSSVEHVDGL